MYTSKEWRGLKIFTARKQSLRRLCFYMCLSVLSCLSCLAGGIPGCLAGLQGMGGVCIPACLAGFQAHTQGGAWGVWLGGGLQAHTQGEVEGSGLGGVSRPTPRGEVEGSGQGRSPGPHLGVYPSMHWGRPLPPPPQLTATAAGGTHPTGIHFCLFCWWTHWSRVPARSVGDIIPDTVTQYTLPGVGRHLTRAHRDVQVVHKLQSKK